MTANEGESSAAFWPRPTPPGRKTPRRIKRSAAAAQLADAKKLLARFDKDADGKLDFDELAAASGQDKTTIKLLGGVFDKDADGALNPEELAAAISKLRP